jgi:8-oxo-dGTP pyrophosphatase MutT (NUDIX family)
MATDFHLFTDYLKKQFELPLPGAAAHMRMTTRLRMEVLRGMHDFSKARKSSVLIVLYPAEESVFTVFIRRPDYAGVHSGQISFPGGKMEEHDPTIIRTALRETEEEIGLPPHKITVLGPLTEIFVPPSNYMIYPFVGVVESKPDLVPDGNEVAEIIHAGLPGLMDPQNQTIRKIKSSKGLITDAPCYMVNGHIIWGATAMILAELLAMLVDYSTISNR